MLLWTPQQSRTGTVTVSGEVVSVNAPTADAGIRVNTDGTIDKVESGVYTQVDSGTDWIIPNASANGVYQVRIVNVTDIGGTPAGFNHAEAAAENTWIDLTADREWAVENVGSGGASSVGYTFDIQIRYGTGPVLGASTGGAFTALSEDVA